jgi:signal transduction histidine kinase
MEPWSARTNGHETSPNESGVKSNTSLRGEPLTTDTPQQAAGQKEQTACRAAVRDDRDRVAQRLNDDVIRRMFGVGLRLQATVQLVDGTAQARLVVAIRDLDLIIAEVRSVIYDRNPSVHLSSEE